MKKMWLFTVLLAVTSPVVAAAPRSPAELVTDVWKVILGFGQLQFLGLESEAIVSGITRLLIWLLLFTVIYGVITWGRTNRTIGFLSRSQGTVVAFVIATISAIFLPVQVLLATGAGWGTIVSLLLIGGPLISVGYLLWISPNTRGWIVLKITICFLLLWILEVMKYWIGVVAR